MIVMQTPDTVRAMIMRGAERLAEMSLKESQNALRFHEAGDVEATLNALGRGQAFVEASRLITTIFKNL